MKKILKIMASFFMVLTLTGCMKMNIDLDFSDADNPTMNMKILYSKEMMDQYDMSVDDLKNSEQLKDYETKVIEETIDDKEYQGVQATVSQSEMKAIAALLEKKDGTYSLSLPLDELTQDMDAEDYESTYSASTLKALGVEFTFKVTMPGEIIKTDTGTIDGNSVTIDLLDVMDKKMDTITIQAKADEANNTILYVGIGVVIIAAIIGFVFMKKKKSHTEGQEQVAEPKTQETTTEPVKQEQVVEPKEEANEPVTQETKEPTTQEETVEPKEVTEPEVQETKETAEQEQTSDENTNEE